MSNHSCCARQRVKRGLWSPEEDEKLVNYVTTHGHGCWSTVPRLAGLQRCGKSCRLRWINYLRPDLKRGNFTSQEAALIIELHRVIGNRWAQIARRLPGRTDNEVKNFWNANIKRKLLQAHHHNLISNSDPTALINNNNNINMMSTNYMNNNNNNPNPSSSSQFIHHQLPPPTFMNYDSALTPPSFDPLLPPLPLSCTYENPINIPEQNYYQPFVPNDDNLSFGQVSSNNNIDDKDLDLLEALMPEFRNIGIDFPLTTDEGVQQLDVLDPTAGNSSFDPALHPTHIKNIASLMATFAPPGSIPPEPWDVPFPESPSFTAASSSWGPHP